jgi:hypothetical protein
MIPTPCHSNSRIFKGLNSLINLDLPTPTKETGFLLNLSSSTQYCRKNPVSQILINDCARDRRENARDAPPDSDSPRSHFHSINASICGFTHSPAIFSSYCCHVPLGKLPTAKSKNPCSIENMPPRSYIMIRGS